MKTFIFAIITLALDLTFSPYQAHACGGVNESTLMCVSLPVELSIFIQDEEVMNLVRERGHIRHLGADGLNVQIAVSDNYWVRGSVYNGAVTGYRLKHYHWPVSSDFLVRIEDYTPLVKLLLSPRLVPELARTVAEKSVITSLYQLSNGQPLIRINGTSARGYSIVGAGVRSCS